MMNMFKRSQAPPPADNLLGGFDPSILSDDEEAPSSSLPPQARFGSNIFGLLQTTGAVGLCVFTQI
jgi:hypothetical protein